MQIGTNKKLLLSQVTTRRELATNVATNTECSFMDRVRALNLLGCSGDQEIIPVLEKIAVNDPDHGIKEWAKTNISYLNKKDTKFSFAGNSATVFVARTMAGLNNQKTEIAVREALEIGLSFAGVQEPFPAQKELMDEIKARPEFQAALAQAEKDKADFGEAPDPFNLTPKQVEIISRQTALIAEVAEEYSNGTHIPGISRETFPRELAKIMRDLKPGNRQSTINYFQQFLQLVAKTYERQKNHKGVLAESVTLECFKSDYSQGKMLKDPNEKELLSEAVTNLEPKEIDLLDELLGTDLRSELGINNPK